MEVIFDHITKKGKMAITQFQGESRRESIINQFSLDIEEEEDFFKFIEAMGYTEDSPDDILESLIETYRNIVD